MKKICLLIGLLLIFSTCGKEEESYSKDDLLGLWEKIIDADNYDNCKDYIEFTDENYSQDEYCNSSESHYTDKYSFDGKIIVIGTTASNYTLEIIMLNYAYLKVRRQYETYSVITEYKKPI